MKFRVFLLWFCLSMIGACGAFEKTSIRIGVQSLGTLEWELHVLEADPDFKMSGIQLQIVSLANAEAGKIALQSGAVDMIVSDWIWVSSQRVTGGDLTFYPYSNTSGALMVPENSPIYKIADLAGKRLGIAGGELDKNWLLLQALAKKQNLNISELVETTFAAPPLLNEQIKQKRLDALLTYWHFASRLETQGYRQIIDGSEILKGLGVKLNVPSLGYVFKQSWAQYHRFSLNDLFKATRQARQKICSKDDVWQSVIPLTHVDDASTQVLLRQRYCQGGVEQWGEAEQKAAEEIYQLLRGVSHNQLTGHSEHLQAGTFWNLN